MKQRISHFAALSTLSLVSLAAAQNAPQTYFGVNTLGVQATYDTGSYALRLSAGPRALWNYGWGLGTDITALFPVYRNTEATSTIALGAGFDVTYYYATGPGLIYRPNVLLNYEYQFNQNAAVFAEGSLGYPFATNGAGGSFYPGVRLGLNFR